MSFPKRKVSSQALLLGWSSYFQLAVEEGVHVLREFKPSSRARQHSALSSDSRSVVYFQTSFSPRMSAQAQMLPLCGQQVEAGDCLCLSGWFGAEHVARGEGRHGYYNFRFLAGNFYFFPSRRILPWYTCVCR